MKPILVSSAACGLLLVGLLLDRPSQNEVLATQQGVAAAPLFGLSRPSAEVIYSSEVVGSIESIDVRPGQHVEPGQSLFRLHGEDEQARVERLELVAGSTTRVDLARAELKFAEQELARIRQLATRDIASAAKVELAEFNESVARIKVAQAEEDARRAQLEHAEAAARLARLRVASTLDGVVLDVLHEVGETVDQLEPVVQVVRLNPLRVEFHCPVDRVAAFVAGAEVPVHRAAAERDVRSATVRFVSPQADASSQSFLIRLELANPDDAWSAGVKIVIGEPAQPAPPQGR